MRLSILPKDQTYIHRYVIFSFIIFFAASLLGYSTALIYTEEILKIFNELIKELSGLSTLGPVTLFLIIFFNNTIKTFIVMILGVFFGITPVFFLLANGYMLGIMIYFAKEEIGINTAEIFWSIAPHGIIEIAAMLIASGYGLWLGKQFCRKLFKKQGSLKDDMRAVINIYARYIIPLFFIAASIETFMIEQI